jgi:hypothetical protein
MVAVFERVYICLYPSILILEISLLEIYFKTGKEHRNLKSLEIKCKEI